MSNHRLIPQVSEVIRQKHFSFRTEKTYIAWIIRFVRFHQMTHPRDMAEPEIIEFLSYLANKRQVAAATQNQALNALVFLYRHVIKKDIGDISQHARAKKLNTCL